MIDARTMELINLRIDGEISPSQRRELEEVLRRDEAARSFARDLERIARGLLEQAEATPSGELKERIQTAIAQKGGRPETRRPDPISPLSGLRSLVWWRTIYRAAAVLVAGVALGWWLGGGLSGAPPIDIHRIGGTMDVPTSGKSGSPAASLRVGLPSVSGRIRWTARGDDLIVEVILKPDAAIEWDLAWDPTGLSVMAVEATALEGLRSARGRIRVRQLAADHWLLSFTRLNDAPESLEFSVFQDHELLLRKTITQP